MSYFLFWAGFISVICASVAYGWHVLSGRTRAIRGVTDIGVATMTVQGTPSAAAGRAGTAMTWLAAAFLLSAVVARTVAVRRPPYGNLWEYFLVLGMAITVWYAIFEWRHRQRALGAFVLPVVALLFTVSETWFSHEIDPLVPALQNNRLLGIHVASMLLSYSVLAVAFGASVIYLLQGESGRFSMLPSADQADEISHSAILVGFPILGLGIALGAYWGNFAWGRYWGWDPKETTALITWLVYAGYLHARALSGWRGKRTALISMLGFAMIVFNIFVVNFVIAGLHSYA